MRSIEEICERAYTGTTKPAQLDALCALRIIQRENLQPTAAGGAECERLLRLERQGIAQWDQYGYVRETIATAFAIAAEWPTRTYIANAPAAIKEWAAA